MAWRRMHEVRSFITMTTLIILINNLDRDCLAILSKLGGWFNYTINHLSFSLHHTSKSRKNMNNESVLH
jgi:hypothetical protein